MRIIRWSVVAAMVAALALLSGVAARAAEKTDKAVADDVWKTTFSDGLLDAAGKAVSPDNLKGKLVAIYFSAHWCPPCKAFTPKLVAFRDKNEADVEVVFVSFDKSQQEKDKYMQEAQMKWPTVPFQSQSGKDLAKKFGVRGIPTLVVLSPKGNTVSATARMEVTKDPDKCIEAWKKAAAEADKK
jgi:nucleoredoxin